MKIILQSLFILFSIFLISCSGSVKGNWSDSDKEQFRSDMMGIEGLTAEWIECYLLKCEGAYQSLYLANLDEEGVEKLAFECSDDVFSNGSVKGNWSDSDKEQFRSDMMDVEGLQSEWIECYLLKCEDAYRSYYHANLDEEGVTKIALKCNAEFGL